MLTATKDVEVHMKPDLGKAIIEGKTSVPFQSFVGLVLQRKVFQLFKTWGREPIIVGSELLTSLASAPQDSQENRAHTLTVTLGIGAMIGILGFAVTQGVLLYFSIPLGLKELSIIAGVIVGLTLLVWALSKLQRKGKSEKFTEGIEKIANVLK